MLDEIAAAAFQNPVRAFCRRPTIWPTPSTCCLTVTNLRGVPFAVNFGELPDPLRAHVTCRSHALPARQARQNGFRHDRPQAKRIRRTRLANPARGRGSATAFPVVLAPRLLSHPRDAYKFRFPKTMVPQMTGSAEEIGGDFQTQKGEIYDFLSVDGGLIDNEPLDLAKRFFRKPNVVKQDIGHHADHAVIMIAPFPGEIVYDPKYTENLRTGLVECAIRSLLSLIEQSRFRGVE